MKKPSRSAPLVEWAVYYGSLGYEVFPVGGESGKRPLTPNGFYDASSDEDAIRELWGEEENANIATASASILDLDVPRKDGDPDGRETWLELLRKYEDGDGYPRVVTGGVYDGEQGEQRWYAPGAPAGHVAPGVDMRGEGNYALMPPSKTTKRYRGELPPLAELPEVPSWILEEQAEYKLRPSSEKSGGRHDQMRAFIFALSKETRNGKPRYSEDYVVQKAVDWAKEQFTPAELRAGRGGEAEVRRMTQRLEWAPEPEAFDAEHIGGDQTKKERPSGLPVRSARYIHEHTPEVPDWLYENYLAKGESLVLSGQPKVGKTTFLFALLAAMERGEVFCGFKVAQGTALVLTEQGRTHIRRQIPLESGHEVVFRREVRGMSWPEIVNEASDACRSAGHSLMIVDSFSAWSLMEEGQENDASVIRKNLHVLQPIMATGVSVVLIHHNRKDGGSHGTGLRGSNALASAVDTILSMDRVQGRKRARFIEADGWHEETHDLKVERQPDGTYARIDLVDSADDDEADSWGTSASLSSRGDDDWSRRAYDG